MSADSEREERMAMIRRSLGIPEPPKPGPKLEVIPGPRATNDQHPIINMERWEQQQLAKLQERARRREERRRVDPYNLGHWNRELDD
jgi:hypothetical protein